jgi:hypothetical protein
MIDSFPPVTSSAAGYRLSGLSLLLRVRASF